MTKINVLNRGYIRLRDVMGDDRTIANAARVSFDRRTEELDERDERLIAFLAQEGHCYDENTEVLTSEGFVRWEEVDKSHKLAVVEPRSGKLKGFEKPIELIKKKYIGEMITFKTHSVDLKVTPGHTLYCSITDTEHKRSNPIYGLFDADMVLSGREVWQKPMRMRTSTIYGESVKDKEYWKAALYGFFIGDGHARRGNRLQFHMKKERKIKFLKKISSKLGLEYEEMKSNNHIIRGKDIGTKFRKLFYDKHKRKTFPDSFYRRGDSFWQGFELGLFNSDGSKRRGTADWIYSTMSDVLADKIQAFGSLYGATFSLKKNSKGLNILQRFSRRSEPRLNDTTSNRGEKVPYDGYIYCATVSTGLLIVRRNNKVVLSGNSSPFRHASLQFEVYAPLMIARQWWKYAIGSDHVMDAWNESSRRYITENEEFYIPSADEWRSYPDDVKQGSGEPIEEYKGDSYSRALELQVKRGERLYNEAMADGIAPEQARLFLPAYGMYVRWYWTASLQSVAHLIKQRTADDAQYEFRLYAEAVRELAKERFPVSLEALLKEGK